MSFWQVKPSKEPKYKVYGFIAKLKEEGPWTAEDLAEDMQCHIKTASRHIREAWMLSLIHICEWDRTTMHGYPVPVFAWGDKKDRPQPTVFTCAERSKRYRDKIRDAV